LSQIVCFQKNLKPIDRKVFVLVFFEQNRFFLCSTFQFIAQGKWFSMKEATAEFENLKALMLSMKIISI
jgi:hypothetical protein